VNHGWSNSRVVCQPPIMLLVMPFSETPAIQLWHLADPSVLTNVRFAPGAVVLSESLLARDTLLMPPRVIHLLAGSLVAWRRPSQLLKQGLRSQGF